MSNFNIHNPDQRALAHLKQRFPHIDTVERLLAEAHLRLREVIDGDLNLDGQTCTLWITSLKTRKIRAVSIAPDFVEPLTIFLADPPATRKAMLTRALRTFGPAYRRWLIQLRYRMRGDQHEKAW